MPREEIPMHDRVLDLLERRGQQDWLSGEALAAELGISRSSLSKHMAALRAEGNVIETMPRRGYKLISRADPWVGDDVQKSLLTRSLGQGRWIWLKDAESTNRVAAHEALDGAEEGLVAAARWQTEPQEGKHSWMK
ncbi:MAG: HTH domain-containing protein [Mailhella sp.]|nr:HTH domain-containing protein [Mailhella sp.]